MMDIKKTLKRHTRVAVIIGMLPFLCAWVDPVDLTQDPNGEGDVLIGGVTVKSCTYDDSSVNQSQCHRWNLLWQPVVNVSALEVQTDWAPSGSNIGADWRLPTIKELSKLVSYGVAGNRPMIAPATIRNWFNRDTGYVTETDTNMKTAWLISSTYRDIDGGAGANEAQVFAINIIDGTIKTFEPGNDDVVAETFELRLCESLTSTGACTYGSTTDHIVYALKVRTVPVSDL